MINKAYILNIAPELASVEDARFSFFVTNMARFVNSAAWGEGYDYAHALLVAHALTMSNRGQTAGGAAGAVSSMALGKASISYASPTATDAGSLGQTSYGSEFLSLRKTLLISPVIV
jgi:hypothetical protein